MVTKLDKIFRVVVLVKYLQRLSIMAITFLAVISCTGTAGEGNNSSIDVQKLVDWRQSDLGGGGYITGIIQNPENPEELFARCDVGGVFKSSNRGKEWKVANKGVTMGYHHNVEAIAISPHNPDILFRGSGEARNHQIIGAIHKSVDGGETWYQVTDKVDFFGNGPNRVYGENIAIDPFNSDNVVAGGYKNGVFISTDTGETWIYSGLKNEPIATVNFHPFLKDHLFVGTLNSLRRETYLFPKGGYENRNAGKLYLSSDMGKTWELLFESPEMEFCELAFSHADSSIIIVAAGEQGLFISQDLGTSFNRSMNGLPVEMEYNTIANDPHQPERFYTAPKREGRHTHVPLVPVYVSENFGQSWDLLKDYSRDDFSNYPSYIKTEEWIGWSISKILVDNADPSGLFMSNWYGVSVSHDRGLSWNANDYRGTETTCAENIVINPVISGVAYFTLPDHRPFITRDYGNTYFQSVTRTEYNNSTALVASANDTAVVLYGGKMEWDGTGGSAILKSYDSGMNFTIMQTFPDRLTVQAIAEDPHSEGIFYAYIDGNISNGAGLYKSENWGESWKRLDMNLPVELSSLPEHSYWVENELLSITYGQYKNVCGTNQLLALDPHLPNTIYFGEWTEGLFKSVDGGISWTDISQNLPFKNDTATALVDVLTDDKNPGTLYAGFIHEGLWKSTDYGNTWGKLFPSDSIVFNASSIALGGKRNQNVFVASEPLYWSPSESAVFFSHNAGKDWVNLYDNKYGALRWKSIALDVDEKVLYGVTAGNGAFYLRLDKLYDKFN
jgi:photosystem II stability/assembly factor-like uncharacterized protein